MQVFRLVKAGTVDRMIAFDSLPEAMVSTVNTRGPDGLPRNWAKWLLELGSYRYEKTKEGRVCTKEPGFYILDYTTVNSDREKWQEIVNYVRRACDPQFRLLDKIEDMAKPMAPNCKEPLDLEPEDVPIIELRPAEETAEPEEAVAPAASGTEPFNPVIPRRRGRPRKVYEEVPVK